MPIFELFSKRMARLQNPQPEVYRYDDIPRAMRVQIIHIWGDGLGNPERDGDFTGNVRPTYQNIVDALRREYGVFKLIETTFDPNDRRLAYSELCDFFLKTKDVTKVLDIIEITLKVIDGGTRYWEYRHIQRFDEVADDAIDGIETNDSKNTVSATCLLTAS